MRYVLLISFWVSGERTGTSQHDYIVAILAACYESGVGWVITSVDYVVTVNYQIDVGWYVSVGKRLKAAV